MPELPEVETITRGLKNSIVGRQLTRIVSYRDGTIRSAQQDHSGRITDIDRRGKYILIDVADGMRIVVHLGMTGKLVFSQALPDDHPHLRASFHFEDGTFLLFIDSRTFGYISICNPDSDIKGVCTLGPEPLSKSFDKKYLHGILMKRNASVKNLLLNQRLIAGIGNIYACEALHRCGIHPERPGSSLSDNETARLLRAIKKVLRQAIDKNGTSISDFRSVEDQTGEFQEFLRVYGKDVCHCGTPIERIKQAGRSTWFCPECQP